MTEKGGWITEEPSNDIRATREMVTVMQCYKKTVTRHCDSVYVSCTPLQTCSINKSHRDSSLQPGLPGNELFSQSALSCNLSYRDFPQSAISTVSLFIIYIHMFLLCMYEIK